jgi:hypothetical protein
MGGLALGIGAGLSGLGSILGASTANRAERKSRDWYDKRTGQGAQRNWNAYFGSGAGSFNDLNNPGASLPTPSSDSILGRMYGLADYMKSQGAGILQGYNNDTARLANMAAQQQGLARQFGQGEKDTINQLFDRQLTASNRQGDAALAAGGFNSPTVRASQYSGNSAQNSLARSQALEGAARDAIDRQLAAGTQGLQIAGSRASGGTGLRQSLLSQYLGLANQPLQSEQQLLQSDVMNPWLSNKQPYSQNQSGLSSALNTAGSGLGAWGSYQLGQQGQASLMNQFGANLPYYLGQQYGPPSPIQ